MRPKSGFRLVYSHLVLLMLLLLLKPQSILLRLHVLWKIHRTHPWISAHSCELSSAHWHTILHHGHPSIDIILLLHHLSRSLLLNHILLLLL